MTDEPPSSADDTKSPPQRSWIGRVLANFGQEPRSQEELMSIMRTATENKILDAEALGIIEGALEVSTRQVRDIMIPRSQMVVVKEEECPQEFLAKIIESGHSRFPVIGETSDDVRGILLAKDLLPLILNGIEDFQLSSILRPANIIPESKRLNVLLREFRENRYHMAIVIDEYGGISGLVTIEDILEEIVGEIEDETDEEEGEDNIRQVAPDDYIVKALTPIEDFNDAFGAAFSDEDFDTVGGHVVRAFGHMPSRNESVSIEGFSFRVLYSDSRKIHLLRVTRPSEAESALAISAGGPQT